MSSGGLRTQCNNTSVRSMWSSGTEEAVVSGQESNLLNLDPWLHHVLAI